MTIAWIAFIGLTLDNFIILLQQGARLRSLTFKDTFLYSLIYAAVRTAACLIGYGCAYVIHDWLTPKMEYLIAGLILFCIGVIFCTSSFLLQKFEERVDKEFTYKKCFFIASGTNLNPILIAAGFAMIGLPLQSALLITVVVTMIACFLALQIGYQIGAEYMKPTLFSGGAMMIVISCIIFFTKVLR